MILRSITLHIPDPRLIVKSASDLERISRVISSMGYSIWSRRVSLPPIDSGEDLREVCKILKDHGSELSSLYIAAFNIRASSRINIEDLIDCMNMVRVAFSSILVEGDGDAEEAYEKLRIFYRSADIDLHTRLASIYRSWILTPYFPASASIVEDISFTVALRYVGEFRKAILGRDLEGLVASISKLDRDLAEVSSSEGVGYGGIDLSLSPWMEESVGGIIEEISGSEIPMPGTISAIMKINRLISGELVRRARATGFNEAMLPVEEDNILKERARMGRIALRDLIGYTPYCVAGVDMAVLPRDRVLSGKILYNVIEDLIGISKTKSRPLGMRIILANGKPGESISLGRFGRASIIDI